MMKRNFLSSSPSIGKRILMLIAGRELSGAALALVIVLVIVFSVTSPAYGQGGTKKSRDDRSQTYQQEGVTVEFGVEPLATTKGRAPELLEGTEATVRFKIKDANSAKSLTNLRPAVWIDRRDPVTETDARTCREKVQSFLQPGFNRRPTIDLNSYFILTLNNEPNISVIDPLSGFAGSKLYALVALPGRGEDWVLSPDRKRLYVSISQLGTVAVVDVASWKVIASIATGANPSRLALQNDGKYLWAGNDEASLDSGVTVIDTATLTVAKRIHTGKGHHEIAFTPDDRFAFITNQQSGTLSCINVRQLEVVRELRVGSSPTSLAFASLSQSVYVTNESDGTVVVVDSGNFETLTRIKTAPGTSKLRIPANGRFAFAANQQTGTVYILDLSTNRLVHSVPVGPGPDQISFTQEFAYVRSAGNEFVSMINLTSLKKEPSEAAVNRFPAGQHAPQESPDGSLAAAIVPAPDPGAVLVANPADKMIYFYMEGMAAPMGSFQNYRRTPRAIMVLNNSLRETEPGVYSTNMRLTEAGNYDVAFLLDAPRLVHCFSLEIAPDANFAKEPGPAIKVTVLPSHSEMRAGKNYQVLFKVTDANSNKPRADLNDITVLTFLAPGIWQHRDLAKPVGDGVYEMNFVPPQAGVYYVFFQCPSLNLKFSQLASVTLSAVAGETPPAKN